MFSKLSIVITSTLVALVAATGTVPPIAPQNSIQCCTSALPSTNLLAQEACALVGLDITTLSGILIGIGCIDIAGNTCSVGNKFTCVTPGSGWNGIAINCNQVNL
ncbi:hypothetical protein C8R46DRAFT_1044105 [Mycena filopes]|nr:hypothetical protein C8R46DRAFT_1044105 [Mycena filopes]